MQATVAERRFLFRGHAVPLAGRIRRPNDILIPPQAPASAAITGGKYSARVDDPQIPGGIVSIRRAESSVDADYEDATRAAEFTRGNHGQNDVPAVTRTWAAVEGLTVTVQGPSSHRELKADRVQMELFSRCSPGQEQPSIRPVKASIEGLTFDGYGLQVILREKMFCDFDTRDKLCSAYESDDGFFSESSHLFLRPDGLPAQRGTRSMPQAGGYTCCTLVDRLAWTGAPHPEARIDGHSVYVPEFGYVYFAEMFVGCDSRRLTMMRMHLGSPDGGEITVVEGDNNGSYWPP